MVFRQQLVNKCSDIWYCWSCVDAIFLWLIWEFRVVVRQLPQFINVTGPRVLSQRRIISVSVCVSELLACSCSRHVPVRCFCSHHRTWIVIQSLPIVFICKFDKYARNCIFIKLLVWFIRVWATVISDIDVTLLSISLLQTLHKWTFFCQCVFSDLLINIVFSLVCVDVAFVTSEHITKLLCLCVCRFDTFQFLYVICLLVNKCRWIYDCVLVARQNTCLLNKQWSDLKCCSKQFTSFVFTEELRASLSVESVKVIIFSVCWSSEQKQ